MNFEPILYTVSASVISAAIIYAFKAWSQDRKERRKERKFFRILLYSSIHASETVIGNHWKQAHDNKKEELMEKDEYVGHA